MPRQLIAFTLLLLCSGLTHAGLLRYDVTLPAPGPGYQDAYGFMLFENPLKPGDIMPYIVDWEFHDPYAGLTFNSQNSVADLSWEFIVDAGGNYVSHVLLCFGPETACEGAFALGTLLMGTSSSWFTYPGGAPIVGYNPPEFSAPTLVAVPAAPMLLIIGLASMSTTRRMARSKSSPG